MTTRLFTALLVLLASLQACSPAKVLYNTSGFKPGYTVSYKFVTNTETTTSVMKQIQNQTTKQETDYSYVVRGINPDKSVNWEVTTWRFRYESEDPEGNPIVYDSSDPKRDTTDIRGKLFEHVVGMKLNMTTAANGDIVSVSGASDMLEKMVKDIPDSPMKTGLAAMMKSSFGDSSIIASMGGLFGFLPHNTVKSGYKWTVSRRVKTLFGLNFMDKYTLKSRNNKTAVIAIKSKVKTGTGDDAVMDLGSVKIQYDLQGEGTGQKTISQPDGMVLNGVNTLTLSGIMTINGSIKAPVTTKTTVTIEQMK